MSLVRPFISIIIAIKAVVAAAAMAMAMATAATAAAASVRGRERANDRATERASERERERESESETGVDVSARSTLPVRPSRSFKVVALLAASLCARSARPKPPKNYQAQQPFTVYARLYNKQVRVDGRVWGVWGWGGSRTLPG
jgi:Ni/Co efflux regulator RcnB